MNHSQAIQQLSALFLKDEESESLHRYHATLESIHNECKNQLQEIENVRRDQEEELERLSAHAIRSYPREEFDATVAHLQQEIELERQKHDHHIRTRETLERQLECLKEENERVDQREDREHERHKESVPSALKKRRVYANIMPIVWQQDTHHKIKGFFHYGDHVEPFEFDADEDPNRVTNALWKIHSEHVGVAL